jgi:hypothetical protein
MALNALAVLLTLGQLGACIPVPQDTGSDLTILINNDLLGERIKLNRFSSADLAVIKGPESPSADSGLILLTSRSREAAAADCAALGEQLWEPSIIAPGLKTASIQPNLDYLTYENKYRSSQQYWIAPDASRPRVIDGEGNIKVVSHRLNLPALCTQSAPFSNSTYQDTSRQWQVTVHSNNEYLTG